MLGVEASLFVTVTLLASVSLIISGIKKDKKVKSVYTTLDQEAIRRNYQLGTNKANILQVFSVKSLIEKLKHT